MLNATIMCSTLPDTLTHTDTMPVHEIRLSLPRSEVINTDVEIEVMSDGVKLGELRLSKGSIDWRPAKARQRVATLTWEQFARVMEDHTR
jgi:hypothetical protein